MKPVKLQSALSGNDRKVNGNRELYSVKWNNYPETILRVFRKYLRTEMLADITLCVDGGKSISCHRILLCACSTYFEEMLAKPSVANRDPSVFFFRDMEFWELEALVAFMYFGEVRVEREKLTQLVKAAGALKIKGLAPQSGTDYEQPDFEDSDVDSSFYSASEVGPSNVSSRMGSSQRHVLIPTKRRLPAPVAPLRKMAKTGINGGNLNSKALETLPAGLVEKLTGVKKPTVRDAAGLSNREQELLCNYEREAMKGWVKGDPDPEDSNTSTLEQAAEVGAEQKSDDVDTVDGDQSAERDRENDEDIENVNLITDDDDVNERNIEEGDDEDEDPAIQPGTVATESKRRNSYDQDLRERIVAALDSGLTLAQCSAKFNVPMKTLDKWKQSGALGLFEDEADEVNVEAPRPRAIAKTPPKSQVKQKRGPGVSIDTGDRAERLRNAMTLALGGTTVRQAAAQYEIPRTTLCAYMKRHGVTARRTFINKRRSVKPKQEFQEDDGYDMSDAYDGALFAPDFLQVGGDEDEEEDPDNFIGAEGEESEYDD